MTAQLTAWETLQQATVAGIKERVANGSINWVHLALLAEHERANANARDAARWRAWRVHLVTNTPRPLSGAADTGDAYDEAADRLIEQEARDE